MAEDEREKRLKDLFAKKQYDVEHALNMYAYSYVTMPAFGIYDDAVLAEFSEAIKNCHIYIIGTLPKINCSDIREENGSIVSVYEVLGNQYVLDWPIPEGTTIGRSEEGNFYAVDNQGQKFAPDNSMIMARLSRAVKNFGFKVLYIGQAFGDDGSRSALDRLKKHETLQKIAIQGVPNDMALTILMLEIMPANRIMTMFNPWAENKDDDAKRMNMGLDVLFDTDEAQRVTLYEASLIRYFKPEFNVKFKDTFPSTNIKALQQCYNKDINAVSAEICFDEIPFLLFSDAAAKTPYHVAHHDLHKEADRKVFFARL